MELGRTVSDYLGPSSTIQGMIETLYKTKTPEKERSECYRLVLAPRPASEDKAYVFMEEHGHWEVKTINTEGRLTREEGLAMFNAAKKNLA